MKEIIRKIQNGSICESCGRVITDPVIGMPQKCKECEDDSLIK